MRKPWGCRQNIKLVLCNTFKSSRMYRIKSLSKYKIIVDYINGTMIYVSYISKQNETDTWKLFVANKNVD